ncbi:MAG: hypothetical protein QW478_11665 [Candidatus Micrarchaeaceae archaeon]
MPLIRSDDIKYKLEEINDIPKKKYKLEHPEKDRYWKTSKKEFSLRIKTAMKDLEPLINGAISSIMMVQGLGHPIP